MFARGLPYSRQALCISMTMHDSCWHSLRIYSTSTHSNTVAVVDKGSNNDILHSCDVSKVNIMSMNNHYQPPIKLVTLRTACTIDVAQLWIIVRMMLTFAWALLLLPLGAPLPTSECKSHLAWSYFLSITLSFLHPLHTFSPHTLDEWILYTKCRIRIMFHLLTPTESGYISTSSCVQHWQRWKLNGKYDLKFTCKISVKLCSYYACKQKSGMELWMRLQEPSWMPMMPGSKCCKPTLKT